MRAQEFITDALVHRAHVGSSDPNDVWHVRDDNTRKLRSRRNEVILSQAQPVVMNPGDAKASYLYTTNKSGRRFRDLPGHHYAYLQGRVVPTLPTNIDQGRQLWFKGGQFIYADTKEPFVSADYVRFAPDRSVVAYNTAQINEALHFVRPGELRGSYTDQQMLQMGFRRAQNGTWFIDQRRWDALIQQGKLKENAVKALEKDLKNPHSYDAIDHMMQSIAKKHSITGKELHDRFVKKHGRVPDDWIKDRIEENFADGKVKGKSRPGRVKRSGASCNGSVTDLRAKAKKYGGERGKMYHWCANMKSGRNK